MDTKNLIRIVNELQDELLSLGNDRLDLDLPQIVVIGGQSSGKSSVIESIVGSDFLPRGSDIVTRRPLILQLINHKDDPKPFGEFHHIPGKRFYDFTQISREIERDTEREVKDKDISTKPINLRIYSPDLMDLTLVDLPGLTRNPVGNQPKDIEQRVADLINKYIEKQNCLILAVTAANQDLATSDAIKMAKKADPEGNRTIGVLTKLDIMDKGTHAGATLKGEHLPLRMGYIGVMNRSQEDIDSKKDMKKALADEKEFFRNHPEYKGIAHKLGVPYLQKYLNKELNKHIKKIITPLHRQFQTEFIQRKEQLDQMQNLVTESDEKILSQTNEQFRKNFARAVGKSDDVEDVVYLSGGSFINHLMNDIFPKRVTETVYEEDIMKREIITAIQNFNGVYLGLYPPDAAFKAVVKKQIEQFRKPSLDCVDSVSQELEDIIKDCANNSGRFSSIKEIYTELTLDHLAECKRKCKAIVNYFVETEKTYPSINRADFVKVTSIENSKPISDKQLLVTSDVIEKLKQLIQSDGSRSNSSLIRHKNGDVLASPEHMKGTVDEYKQLVDNYVVIEKDKFRDSIPKLCIIEMVDSTLDFIAVDLRIPVRQSLKSMDDIIAGDTDEELRKELTEKMSHFEKAIKIIDKFTQLEEKVFIN